ncbi:hypothetical protein STEG23_001129, partial [Scotinomys teguina]
MDITKDTDVQPGPGTVLSTVESGSGNSPNMFIGIHNIPTTGGEKGGGGGEEEEEEEGEVQWQDTNPSKALSILPEPIGWKKQEKQMFLRCGLDINGGEEVIIQELHPR